MDSLATLLKGANLYLVGLMGSGKSTIGQHLAEALAYRWLDTDALVEQVAHRSIAEIFAEAGEPGFRELETQVLGGVAAYRSLVVSTGGGIVLARENWGLLRHGIVIWLDVAPALIVDRLRAKPEELASRPLLQGNDPLATLERLREERSPLYRQADVHLSIAGPETPEEIATRTLAAVRSSLRPEILNPALNPALNPVLNRPESQNGQQATTP